MRTFAGSSRTAGCLAAGAVLLALLSACTSSVGGAAHSGPTTKPVPGTLQASFVPIDQVSSAVGVTLSSSTNSGTPPAPLAANPAACAVAIGPATQKVYTQGWTVFGAVTYQDSNYAADHTVTQTLGRYPDATQAGAVFTALATGVKACPAGVRTDPDQGTTKWTYTVDTANTTANTLVWTATQDAGGGWACYRQARLKGTNVIEVAVCEAGNGKPAAATIADRFAGKLGG